MALNPLKVFLFVIGGTVAAAATAFYAGQWQPQGAGREASSAKETIGPSGSPTAAAKPEVEASLDTRKPAAGLNPVPTGAESLPAQGGSTGKAGRMPPAAAKPSAGVVPAEKTQGAAKPSAGDPPLAADGKATQPARNGATSAGEGATAASGIAKPDTHVGEAASGAARVSPASEAEGSAADIAAAPATPAQKDAEPSPEIGAGNAIEGETAGQGAGAGGEQKQASLEPQAQPAVTDPAAQSPGAQIPVTNDPKAAEPDASAAPTLSGQAAKSPTVPSFDVLRVEPDGSTVVAGRGAPKAKIEMLQSGQVLASAEANEDGEFAIVLDEPLKPGDHAIQLRGTKANGEVETSDQTAVVSVPAKQNGQVLAMVEEPGAPSRVLTMPEGETPAAKAGGDAPTGAGAKAPAVVASKEKTAGTSPEREAAPVPGEESAAGASAAKGAAVAPRAVSVQAVEIEGRRIYVAGIAAPNAAIRVYANDIRLGDARASAGGQFLVEAVRDLPVGSYTVRADVLNGRGAVTARAAVPFEREAGENLAAVAPELEAQANAREAARPADAPQPKPAEKAAAPMSGAAAAPAADKSQASTAQAGQPTSQAAAGAELAGTKPAAETSVPATQELAAAEPPSGRAKPEAGTGANAAMAGRAAAPAPGEDAEVATAGQTGETAPSQTPTQDAADASESATQDIIAPVEPSGAVVEPEAGSAAGGASAGSLAAPAAGENAQAAPSAQASANPVPKSQAQGETAASGEGNVAALEADKSETAPLTQAAPVPETTSAGNSDASAAEGSQVGAASEAPNVASAEPAADGVGPVTVNAPKLQTVDAAVIIRRGDSLWRISRRVYGFGTRYSTIYLANTDQIRNPDLIMPGQVFAVPSRSQQGEAADLDAMGDQATTRPSSTAGN